MDRKSYQCGDKVRDILQQKQVGRKWSTCECQKRRKEERMERNERRKGRKGMKNRKWERRGESVEIRSRLNGV